MSDTTDEYLPQKARLVMTLRAQAVMSPNILSAIEQTPREKFVPDHLKAHAYENASLPIGNGQTISQPYIVAKMTEYLELNKRHRVWKSAQEAVIRQPYWPVWSGGYTPWSGCAR